MLRNMDYEVLKFVAVNGKANMSLLKQGVGLTWTSLTSSVDRLVASGLLVEERGGFPPTRWLRLTEKGLQVIEEAAEKISEEAAEGESWVIDESLEVEVAKRLHVYGAALTLQPVYGEREIIFTAGFLPIKDLIRSFSALGSEEREYLEFLAKLYVNSPRKLFGERPKSFIELRACWQLVKPNGWNNADIRGDCFAFDYPAAWKTLYWKLTSPLKDGMDKLGRDDWRTFRFLRAFSFSQPERHRLAKEGKLIVPPTPPKNSHQSSNTSSPHLLTPAKTANSGSEKRE